MNFLNCVLYAFFSEPRFSKMILYSLFIHLLMFSAILGTPPARRNIDFVPFYTVDLVSLPSTMLQPLSVQSDNTPKETTLSLLKETKDSKKTALKEEDSSKELAATITKIKEKVAKERMAHEGEEDIARTISQIREKIALKGQEGLTNLKVTPSRIAGQSPSALTPGAYQMNLYLTVIWEKIRSSWNLPSNLGQDKKSLESIIAIKIRRNGEIVDTNYEKKSGNRSLDESAIRAIKKANPFPPLPDGFRDDYLEIGIRFRPSDLG